MSRWPLLLLVVCAAALGVSACGSDDGSSDSVGSILSDTFGKGKEVKSGRLDLSFKLNAQGLQSLKGPVALRLSGPFQSSGQGKLPKFDFTAGLDSGGQQLSLGAISTGDQGFVRFQNQAYQISDALFAQFKKGYADQAKCSAKAGDQGGVSFSSLGIRPSRWLKDPKKAGTEKVGGADTTHITGTVDVPALLQDVNRILGRTNPQQADPCGTQKGTPAKPAGRQLTAKEQQQIAQAVKNAKVEIWTGTKDRTMRRINVTLAFDVPQAQRKSAGGLSTGDLAFDLTIGDLNKPQTVKAPSSAKPLDDLIKQFGGQVPGINGASGSGTSGGAQGASAAPSASGGSKYDQCLAGAGQDVTKLQQCSSLIGQ